MERREMSGVAGPIDPPLWVSMLIAGFFAISIYNVVEIFIQIFHTFRRRRGLYFWSLVTTNCGILLHSITVFIRFYAIKPDLVAPDLALSVLICVGWWAMVTGSAVVLYSRLHLVVCDQRTTRFVLAMMITSFFVFHVPVSILFIATNSGNSAPFIGTFNVYERIQLVGFTVQESVISAIYIWQAHVNLKPILALQGSKGNYFMRHLIILFIVVLVLDISVVLSEFTNNFDIQTTYKPVVYSIKLKVEFYVLNELVNITRLLPTCHDQDLSYSLQQSPSQPASSITANGSTTRDTVSLCGIPAAYHPGV